MYCWKKRSGKRKRNNIKKKLRPKRNENVTSEAVRPNTGTKTVADQEKNDVMIAVDLVAMETKGERAVVPEIGSGIAVVPQIEKDNAVALVVIVIVAETIVTTVGTIESEAAAVHYAIVTKVDVAAQFQASRNELLPR